MLIVLLLAPIALEFIFQIQFQLFDLFVDPTFFSVARSASYYLGGIVFVIAFRPIPLPAESPAS
jgi:hypothetical protein